ncbi:MAG: hypothetical protein AAGC60_00090 [Acidobacteriota bacterium]
MLNHVRLGRSDSLPILDQLVLHSAEETIRHQGLPIAIGVEPHAVHDAAVDWVREYLAQCTDVKLAATLTTKPAPVHVSYKALQGPSARGIPLEGIDDERRRLGVWLDRLLPIRTLEVPIADRCRPDPAPLLGGFEHVLTDRPRTIVVVELRVGGENTSEELPLGRVVDLGRVEHANRDAVREQPVADHVMPVLVAGEPHRVADDQHADAPLVPATPVQHLLEDWSCRRLGGHSRLDENANELDALTRAVRPRVFLLLLQRVASCLLFAADSGVDDRPHNGA